MQGYHTSVSHNSARGSPSQTHSAAGLCISGDPARWLGSLAIAGHAWLWRANAGGWQVARKGKEKTTGNPSEKKESNT